MLVEDRVEHLLESKDLIEVEFFNDDAKGQFFAVLVDFMFLFCRLQLLVFLFGLEIVCKFA